MQVTKDITWVGVLDPDLEVFDVVIPTEWGTTYNSYLIKAEKPCLIDTVKVNFTDEFLHKVEQEIDLNEIEYLVVNHTEPDHSGAVGALLEKAPHIKVYGTRPAVQFLQEQIKRDFEAVIVKHNDTLDLGNKTLRFIMAPFLHWPDTMFSYLEEDEILFTCDGFGSHYCDPEGRMFVSEIGDITPHIKYYYEAIMSPFKPKILEAVEKVRPLAIKMIATGHGPILDRDFWHAVDLYQEWSGTGVKADPKIVIGYASAYGHTKMMADLIAEGVRSAGQEPVLIDFANDSEHVIKAALQDFDGLVVGSPTINADAVEPVWRALSHVSAITSKGKLAAVFGNYGWSGEAVDLLENRLERMRLAVVQPGLKVRFGLSEENREQCREFGRTFARAFIKEAQPQRS
ncbi:MAG: FprA family A-type flavoprotein [Candidatus Wallacebacter cryptica]|nr:FprA family A-type flavoprotein [Bacillota bacterium]